MAWALSCFLLRQHYNDVVLYTTKAGRILLIDQLKLPYTEVHILPEFESVNQTNWVLAKLLTYREQTTPFLHVDGDVFLWKPLPDHLINSSLIAQNAESDRAAYETGLQMIIGQLRPLALGLPLGPHRENEIVAYNMGIFGGHDIAFLQKYTQLAIHLAQTIIKPDAMETAMYCQLIEQYLLAQLTRTHSERVATVFSKPVTDIGYPGFDDCYRMRQNGYWHLMGRWKQDRSNLNNLRLTLREQWPETYYAILRLVKANAVIPDVGAYQLPELDPLKHNTSYFNSVVSQFQPDQLLTEPVDWHHYYAKELVVHQQLQTWIGQRDTVADEQLFMVNQDFMLDERTEPVLKQQIVMPDICTLTSTAVDLDPVSMIVLDALIQGNSNCNQLVCLVAAHYSADEVKEDGHLLRKIVLDRLQKLLLWGAIRPTTQ